MDNVLLLFRSGRYTWAVVMMLMVSWLAISTPLFCKWQAEKTKAFIQLPASSVPDSNNGLAENLPMGNPEEKSESTDTGISDYLCSTHNYVQYLTGQSRYRELPAFGFYIAFHGELLCPPPEA